MNKNHNCIIGTIITLTLIIIMTQSVMAEDTMSTIEIKPNSFDIKQGEAFNVDIYVVLDEDADTVGIDHFEWDPKLATLDGIEAGNLFEAQTIWINGKNIDNQNGTADWVCWGSQVPSNGQGIFAVLKFTALKDGTFSIHIPLDKIAVARNGNSLQATIIGTNPDVTKSQETFLPSLNTFTDNPLIMIVCGVLIGLLIVIMAVLYVRNRKKAASQSANGTENIKE